MKIVVLDGYTLNPGDLNWDELASLGELAVHDRTPPNEVLSRAEKAEIVLTNKTLLSGDTIGQLSSLRYIGVLATGYNVVDLPAARQRGIIVTNVPAYGTTSVAQAVFAHLLNLTQRVSDHSNSVRDGDWSRSKDFCYWNHPLVELTGLTMGIVGLGQIGTAVARIAVAFGMDVIAHDPYVSPNVSPDVRLVGLDDLFGSSDVVSLHCPLTEETEGLVDRRRLSQMKRSAFLINTSRGPLIDEAALAEALNEDRIAGAGLDVLSIEPPTEDNPLLRAKNVFITPHIAWATRASRARLMNIATENVRAFLEGNPRNTVGGS